MKLMNEAIRRQREAEMSPFCNIVGEMESIANFGECDDQLVADMEAFDKTKLLLSGTQEMLRRIVVTMRNNILSVLTDLKQSELRRYYDMRKNEVDAVKDAKFHKVMDAVAYLPTGMKCTYIEAVATLMGLYKSLDIVIRTQGIKEGLEDIYRDMSRGNMDQYDTIAGLLKMLTAEHVDRAARDLVVDTTGMKPRVSADLDESLEVITAKVFAEAAKRSTLDEMLTAESKDNSSVQFKHAFKSIKEYDGTFFTLLNSENQLEIAEEVYANMKEIDDIAENLVLFIGKEDVPGEVTQYLASVVRGMAIYLHHYGFALATQMRLEHNLILTTHAVYKTL